jgi:hypothetical protein
MSVPCRRARLIWLALLGALAIACGSSDTSTPAQTPVQQEIEPRGEEQSEAQPLPHVQQPPAADPQVQQPPAADPRVQQPPAGQPQAQPRAPGRPGSRPGDGSGRRPQGRCAPIRIPLPADTLDGADFDQAKPGLERTIRQLCGNGELCVTVVAKVDDDPSNDDQPLCNIIVGPGPFEGVREVERGSELVFLINKSCSATESPQRSPLSNDNQAPNNRSSTDGNRSPNN